MANLMGLGDVFEQYRMGSLGGRPQLAGLADLIGGGRPPLLPPGIAGPVEFGAQPQPEPQAPQPSRGQLADLLEQLGMAPPQGPQGFGDLPQDQRRGANMQAIAMLAQAIGGAQPGRLGASLGQAAAAMPAQRQAVVEQERMRMAEEEEQRRAQIAQQIRIVEAQRELEREEQEEAKQAAGIERASRLAEVIATLVPPGDPLNEQASIAAAEGDVKALNGILAQARRNAALRQQGLDPDDPFVEDRFKSQQGIENQEALRDRGLGTYYQPPQRPQTYAPEIEEFADGIYLVDRTSGTRKYLGPPKAGGGASDPEEGFRTRAYNETLKRMEKAADPSDFDFEREFEQTLFRLRGALGGQMPTPEGLPPVDPALAQAGARGVSGPVYPVNPKPRRGSLAPPGIPTSDTGPQSAKPKGEVDEVLAELGGAKVKDPRVLKLIEEELAAGRSVREIVREIQEAIRVEMEQEAARARMEQGAAMYSGGV